MDKLFTLLLLPLAAARPSPRMQLADTEYDYIIVGGGTSGLTVSNRLSEDPSISVLVVERGGDVQDNFNVTNVDNDNFGRAVGTDLDYALISDLLIDKTLLSYYPLSNYNRIA